MERGRLVLRDNKKEEKKDSKERREKRGRGAAQEYRESPAPQSHRFNFKVGVLRLPVTG